MEIGHNVMHGQWDWMNDPDINSQNWDWDTASPADAWRHSHNYEHHTFTNIRGKDRDLGYEIMRIDPHQTWHPVYLLQPLYNLLLMGFFEWGVALHDLNFDAIRAGEKSKGQVNGELKAIGVKAREQIVKDYIAFPLLSAPSRVARGGSRPAESRKRNFKATLAANFTANIVRNVWAYSIIFCGHFPDQTYTFSEEEVEDETRGGWYVRQLLGSANIDGGPLFHLLAGNLELPGRAPPLPRHALQPLRRDRPARARHLPPLRPALQHRPAAAGSSAPSTARSCGWRSPAGRSARSRAPTGPSRYRFPASIGLCGASRGISPGRGARSGGRQGQVGWPAAAKTASRSVKIRYMSATAGPIEAPETPAELLEAPVGPTHEGPTPEEIQEPVHGEPRPLHHRPDHGRCRRRLSCSPAGSCGTGSCTCATSCCW